MSWLRRMKLSVFNNESQGIMFLIAISSFTAGGICQFLEQQAASSYWRVWLSIGAAGFLGSGASVFATGLTFHLANAARGPHERQRWGITYLGDSQHFEWRKWLLRTHHNQRLVFIGRRHRTWLTAHFADLITLTQTRDVSVELYFIGRPEDIRSNVELYSGVLRAQEQEHGVSLRRTSLFDGSSGATDMSDLGFYWNGHSLLVKLYVEETNRPLFEFDGTCLMGSLETGDLSNLPFEEDHAIRGFILKARNVLTRRRPWTA